MFLSPYNINYFREIYNLRTLAAGLGGIVTICKILGLVLVYPFSKNLFYINVMKQLYFVNTMRDDLVTSPKSFEENSKNTKKRLKY